MFTQLCRLPILTLAAVFLLSIIQLLSSSSFDILVFDSKAISDGEVWRLFSGHLVHTDWSHLFWNAIALTVIGSWLEYHSRRLLVGLGLASILAIDLLLLSPWASIEYYCGLSGVLNGLIIAGFFLYWRRFPSVLTALAISLYLIKNITEAILGHSVLTDPAWSAYVPAHFAGALAGVLVLLGVYFPNFFTPLLNPFFRRGKSEKILKSDCEKSKSLPSTF